ncbi:hypothetical protein HK102_000603 [Quaeritorhiza haematococci]|nr:hypothetical protein HK102_000603 [Quaeritorhiza haematococci]
MAWEKLAKDVKVRRDITTKWKTKTKTTIKQTMQQTLQVAIAVVVACSITALFLRSRSNHKRIKNAVCNPISNPSSPSCSSSSAAASSKVPLVPPAVGRAAILADVAAGPTSFSSSAVIDQYANAAPAGVVPSSDVDDATLRQNRGSRWPRDLSTPAELRAMQIEVTNPTDRFEFVLSNRERTHWTADTSKNESRKWHGLVNAGWTSLLNFWLDISPSPNSRVGSQNLKSTIVMPHAIEHAVSVTESGGSRDYSEKYWLVRNQDAMVIEYRTQFDGPLYFRPILGFRKDWNHEVPRADKIEIRTSCTGRRTTNSDGHRSSDVDAAAPEDDAPLDENSEEIAADERKGSPSADSHASAAASSQSCTHYFSTNDQGYQGTVRVMAIHVSRPSKFQRYDQPSYPYRRYQRDEARNDVGPTRFVYEPGKIEIAGRGGHQEPVYVIIGQGATREQADKVIAEVKNNLQAKWDATVQPLVDLVKRGRIESDSDEWDKSYQWTLASLDSLTMNIAGRGIYAGLNWFYQYWGRDSFISFPGALLTTGQFDMAREFILTMARNQDMNPSSWTYGRVPNILQPDAKNNNYETADGTGWWVRAIWSLFQYNGIDVPFLQRIWKNIEAALQGQLQRRDRNGVFVTHAPRETWMDALYEGKVITPRGDRAVEIQALFFTALDIGSRLAKVMAETSPDSANYYKNLAAQYTDAMQRIRGQFLSTFWNNRDEDLFDHIRPDGSANAQKRPNMIYVITVPLKDNPLLPEDRALKVLRSVVKNNVAPHGVRTLVPSDPEYRPVHDGTGQHHDYSYHNGNVWPFLSGPVIEASLLLGNPTTSSGPSTINSQVAYNLTTVYVKRTLSRDTLGSLEEVMDGTDPDPLGNSRAAMSQAWSLAEFARVVSSGWMGIEPQLAELPTVGSVPTAKVSLTVRPLPSGLTKLSKSLRIGAGTVGIEYSATADGIQVRVLARGYDAQQTRNVTLLVRVPVAVDATSRVAEDISSPAVEAPKDRQLCVESTAQATESALAAAPVSPRIVFPDTNTTIIMPFANKLGNHLWFTHPVTVDLAANGGSGETAFVVGFGRNVNAGEGVGFCG